MEVVFAEGEELLTEISTKFAPGQVISELADCGLGTLGTWTDEGGDFILALARICWTASPDWSRQRSHRSCARHQVSSGTIEVIHAMVKAPALIPLPSQTPAVQRRRAIVTKSLHQDHATVA